MPPLKKPRVLFVLKLRQTSGGSGTLLKSSGLHNSASFVHEMLVKNGFDSRLVQVVDNNCIDREVSRHRPDIVVIEALWVVPEKLDLLRRIHKKVKWVVRLHSEIPFLANEGVAFEWINAYLRTPNVYVSANSEITHRDLIEYCLATPSKLDSLDKLVYLPNYYPVKTTATVATSYWKKGETIDVGCFGAVRPMKNHLLQAAAAVRYAEKHGLKLRFHINAGRVEQRGDVVLKNLRAFFAGLAPRHELVEHGWLERDDFLALIRKMDFGMQVSFSETFNIVSADFVSEDTPIVVSNVVRWMPGMFTADPNDVDSIVSALERVLYYDRVWAWMELPRKGLRKYVNESERTWCKALLHL